MNIHSISDPIRPRPLSKCVCVCIERLTIKFSERAKPLLGYEFYRVFFSRSVFKYEYFVSNKAQKNVYLADVGFYGE